ncbi:hypothetical protein [Methanomassiliicoccus luminyensis]|nr:hypothetical protein [Methanomassiliicoccus luminyensis]
MADADAAGPVKDMDPGTPADMVLVKSAKGTATRARGHGTTHATDSADAA